MSDESIGICTNCYKKLPESKLPLHEAYCFRNVKPCSKCKEMIDKKEQETHDQENHALKVCPDCKKQFEAKFFENHVQKCEKKAKFCDFCNLKIDAEKFFDHAYQCGSRTKACSYCNKNVLLRDFEIHENECLIKMTEYQNVSHQQPSKKIEVAKKPDPINYSQKPSVNIPPSYDYSQHQKDKDLAHTKKETNYKKDPAYKQKEPLNYPQKEISNYQKEPIGYQKEPIVYQKDLINYQKEPIGYKKEPIGYQKEPVGYQKEPYGYQKEPIGYQKETIAYQKEPIGAFKPLINNNPANKPVQNQYKPGIQYEKFMQKEREKLENIESQNTKNLYSQQAMINNPSKLNNPSNNNQFKPTKPITSSKTMQEELPKDNKPGSNYNFYEKKNSFDLEKDKKRHMQDYNKEYPDLKNDQNKIVYAPNFNPKRESLDSKKKLQDTKSAGINTSVGQKNTNITQNKPAPTSYSNKAMNLNKQPYYDNKDKPEKDKNYVSDESYALNLQNELYANPNEYVNPNDRKKPPPKSNTYEEFDPDDDPDLQEAILQSKYK